MISRKVKVLNVELIGKICNGKKLKGGCKVVVAGRSKNL